MKTSQRGLAEIAAHEGIVMSKYKDSVGVWTIGIGHTKNAGHPDPAKVKGELPLDKIMEIFACDIKKFERRVLNAFNSELSQSQFDAAVSFDFNTGGIHRASWVKLFNQGHEQAARRSFMKWRKPREIIPRRQAECNLFFDGRYSSDGNVNVYRATSKGSVLWSSGNRVVLPNNEPAKNYHSPQQKPTVPNKPNTKNLVVIAAIICGVSVAFFDKIKRFFNRLG
ncbi:MAG: lysozyme [Lentilitoribacter sp.]